MLWRADTDNRGRTKFSEIKRGLFLPFFYAKSGMNGAVFDHPEQGGKRNQLDCRAQKRKFLDQLLKDRRKQVHLCMVVTADFKRNKVFVVAKTFACGGSSTQDQLRIRKKQKSFLSQIHLFACPAEKFDAKLFLHRLNLVADGRLCDFQFFRRPGEIQMLGNTDKTFQLYGIHNYSPVLCFLIKGTIANYKYFL